MKLSRLLQPRNPQFWLLVVLNGLSTAISFILRSYQLPVLVSLVLAGFAIGNFVLGIRIAWRLMADEPAAK
jgi:Kef-type K+ transport system membrane component KefB